MATSAPPGTLEALRFDNLALRALPVDDKEGSEIRQVRCCIPCACACACGRLPVPVLDHKCSGEWTRRYATGARRVLREGEAHATGAAAAGGRICACFGAAGPGALRGMPHTAVHIYLQPCRKGETRHRSTNQSPCGWTALCLPRPPPM